MAHVRVGLVCMCHFILITAYRYRHTSDVTGPDTSATDFIGTSVTPERLCGDGLCLCDESKADCSGHLGKMAYIPKLPDNIIAVDLTSNNFNSDNLTDDFFANLTHVQSLDLSHNNISWLPKNALKGMKGLERMSLNGNKALTPASLREVLSLQSLTVLSVQHCNLPPPAKDLFKNTTSYAYSILFDFNPHGGTYNLQGFCPLRSLRNLHLPHCDFKEIASSCPLELLSKLDLSGNTLRTFPRTCLKKGVSMFPALVSLSLHHNRIDELYGAKVCLPALEHLDMSYNYLKWYPPFTFSSLNFPALEKLSLHHQSSYWDMFVIATKIHDRAFDNPNLRVLDLRNSELEFAESVERHAFANCYNLRELFLDSNNFTHVDDQRFFDLFGHMRSLTTLMLANNKLELLSTNTFAAFPKLAKLSLNDNIISNIPDGAFDSLARLETLFLHNNKITVIGEHTFDKELRRGLSALTLGFNPFICSCNLLWFQRWFLTENPQLFNRPDMDQIGYRCHNIPGTSLANFSMTEQACLLTQEVNLFIIQTSSILIFALTLVSLIFRYRWHIRLLMYEVFRGRDDVRRRRLQANNFDFDVFVSYASEDLPWVREHLMAKLEDELGLRLCIHERDFVLGNHIVDNIVQCVDSSKKILMVFSADFMRSQWCQFELALCLTHVMDHDDALIVVCVDDVTTRQMTSAMMAVLKTTTYIQWREEEDAVVSFWGRLDLALNEILPQNEQYV